MCRTVFAACLLLLPSMLAAEDRPSVRRSDVVFMYDDPAMYETYGCTVLGWAGPSDPKQVELAHSKGVRLVAASVGFRTEGRGVIDFTDDFLDAACRNFAGETFIVPWLWDHKHKGQPFWWWCTNSPVYHKYLDSRIQKIMQSPLDGLHIDDYTGTAGTVTWQSGCFCRYCLAGFREYLEKNVPREKLKSLRIEDVAKFDYRQFLLDQGVKPEEYNKRRGSLPLAAEFHDFHVKSNDAYVARYRRQAEQYRGKPLAFAVNSHLSDPTTLVVAPQLSYFCCEVGHNAAARALPSHPIYIYKLADAVGRPVTSTASGQDWAYVMEHKLPGLVRTWAALSYTFGHNLMAPHRQWCYTQEKGTHWYTGPAEQYAPLYRFVRRSARLLDGYDAAAPVAVVYDNAARRKGLCNIEPICAALAERNVPFTSVAAGDDWLDYRLDAGRLAKFKAVVVAKDFDKSPIDAAQKKLLEDVNAAGRLVVWPDDKRLAELVPVQIAVEGSERLTVVPRVSGDAAAPAVIHVLNRAYDGKTDAMIPQEKVVLRVRRDLFPGKPLHKAVLHTYDGDPRDLEVAAEGESVVVRIPRLDLWGIIELQ